MRGQRRDRHAQTRDVAAERERFVGVRQVGGRGREVERVRIVFLFARLRPGAAANEVARDPQQPWLQRSARRVEILRARQQVDEDVLRDIRRDGGGP